MKQSKFSEEQIAYALRQAESGTAVADVCRQIGVSEATFYVWKKKFARLGVSEPRWTGKTHAERHDFAHPYLAFRHELCISCGRCVRACDEVQGTFALTHTGRGFEANIAAGLDGGFADSACVSCGACADTCPTDAITEFSLL